MIATTAPITGRYSGTVGGRLNASSSPVTTADRSDTVEGIFRSLHQRYSHRTQEAVVTATTSRLRRPKMIVEATSAGSIAMITLPMTRWVVRSQRICGTGDTTRWLV